MASTKQRVAKIIRVVARVIGFGVTAVLFFASVVILNYGKFVRGDVLLLISFVMALAGCIASRWQAYYSF